MILNNKKCLAKQKNQESSSSKYVIVLPKLPNTIHSSFGVDDKTENLLQNLQGLVAAKASLYMFILALLLSFLASSDRKHNLRMHAISVRITITTAMEMIAPTGVCIARKIPFSLFASVMAENRVASALPVSYVIIGFGDDKIRGDVIGTRVFLPGGFGGSRFLIDWILSCW